MVNSTVDGLLEKEDSCQKGNRGGGGAFSKHKEDEQSQPKYLHCLYINLFRADQLNNFYSRNKFNLRRES